MKNVQVRAATYADFEELRKLLYFLHDEESWPDSESQKARMQFDAIVANRQRRIVVADFDNEIIGTADIVVIENMTRGLRPFAVVENVVVKPSHRRMGIGRKLLDAAIEFATASSCYKVQLISADK